LAKRNQTDCKDSSGLSLEQKSQSEEKGQGEQFSFEDEPLIDSKNRNGCINSEDVPSLNRVRIGSRSTGKGPI